MSGAQTRDRRTTLISLGNKGFVRSAFLGMPQSTLRDERVVRIDGRRVHMKSPRFDLPDARCHSIQKIAIVGNDEVGALIGGDVGFKPTHRLNIQMIGRFVEDAVVRFVDQYVGERGFCALAARKFAQRTCERLVAESE